MHNILRIVSNRNTLMLLALALGIVVGEYAIHISFLSLPVLSFMMTVSLVFFSFSFIFTSSKAFNYSMQGLLLNYVLSGLVLMGLTYIIIPYERDIYLGFLFIVLAPPGVVIVPFATLFNGNINHAATGVIAGNLALIIIFPLMMYFVSGGFDTISPFEILKILTVVIFIPLIISRFLRHKMTMPVVRKYRAPLINWSFFIIIYIVIGLNRDILINQTEVLILPVIVLLIYLFLFTFLFDKILVWLKVPSALRISQTLMFAVKNNGFSAVVSLSLIGAQAAIPSAALSIVLLIYLIVFSIIYTKKNTL